ncbi:MAG: hypothetical protein WBP81_03465 [Solirubrobacteraceae bacterium]
MPSELTLSLFMGPVAVEPVPRAVMEALTEVNVNVSSSDPSGFELKFATSKRSQITTRLLPSGYFDPPKRVVIAATLRGQMSVLMDGVITQQEVVPSDEATNSVLSIKGEDLTRMMDLVDLSGFPFPAMPAEGRILVMLLKYTPIYKIVPLILPSVLIDIENPLQSIPVQRGTDLVYIKQLADRVGYAFYLQPGPLPGMSMAYWGPSLRAAIPFLPQPTPFAIDWDGRSNVESLQFSFDGFKKTQFVVLIQQRNTNFPIPIPVPDVTPLSPPLGAKSPMPLRISPLTGLAKYSPIEAAAIALARASDAANVIGGSGSLDVLRYGEILSARTVVRVQGAGITYDGDYYVDSVSHAIKPGSYKQRFTLLRNAFLPGTGIAGLDALSYGLSVPQQLAGFADAAATSAATPPLGLDLLASLPLPGPSLGTPPNPSIPSFPGATPGGSLPGPPPPNGPAGPGTVLPLPGSPSP